MNAAKSSPPWYARWRQRARPEAAPGPDDLADLGTAFGLDLATQLHPTKDEPLEPLQRPDARTNGGWVQRPGWRNGRSRAD